MAASGSASGVRVALVAAAACAMLTLNAVQAQPTELAGCMNCAKGCFARCTDSCRKKCSIGPATEGCKGCRSQISLCAYFLCYRSTCPRGKVCGGLADDLCHDCDTWCGVVCASNEAFKRACQPQCEKDPLAPLCVACTRRAIERCQATCYERNCIVEQLCPSRAVSPELCSQCDVLCKKGCIDKEILERACPSECHDNEDPFAPPCIACAISAVNDTCRADCYARKCVAGRACPSDSGSASPQRCSECHSSCHTRCITDADALLVPCPLQCPKFPGQCSRGECGRRAFDTCTADCYALRCPQGCPRK